MQLYAVHVMIGIKATVVLITADFDRAYACAEKLNSIPDSTISIFTCIAEKEYELGE